MQWRILKLEHLKTPIKRTQPMLKCFLIFDDWRQLGKSESIYSTELGVKLSKGDLHSGSVCGATVIMDSDIEAEIIEAMKKHQAYPVFRLKIERESNEGKN